MTDPAPSSLSPAEAYDLYQVPALFGPFAGELVTRADPRPGERAPDLACGTGVVARQIAPLVMPGGYVDALDLNLGMLSVARDVARRAGTPITFHDGDMQALPFAGRTYDLVTCHQGLQFVPDRGAAVQEMRRMLRPGGRAVVSCWSGMEHSPLYTAMAPVVARLLGVPALDEPFGLSRVSELRELFAAADFTTITIEAVQLTTRYPQPEQFVTLFVSAMVASIATLHATTPAAREQLIATLRLDLERVLGDFIVGDEVHSPRETHIVRAVA
jgi:SAM-dependent methyltransferase